MEVIMQNLPIVLCVLVGVALMVVEAFMPGFGVAGFFGIAAEIVAVILTFTSHGLAAALVVLLIGVTVSALAVSFSLRSIAKGKLSDSPMVLRETESADKGYSTSEDMQVFLNKEGTATTVLRPTGMAEFNGVKLNVVSDGEFIPAGTPVRITAVEGARIIVHKI